MYTASFSEARRNLTEIADRTAFERSWVKAYSAKRFLELFPPAESGEG